MPMHTNYGQHLAVTIVPLRQGRFTESNLWSVQQRYVDPVRVEQGLTPCRPVGYGFAADVHTALAHGLSHAANVHGAAMVLTNLIETDAHREDVVDAIGVYSRTITDDRAEQSQDPEK
jgi:hypothetical protein